MCMAALAVPPTGPGRDIIVSGVSALLQNRPDMNTLVGLGATASFGVSCIAAAMPRLGWKTFFEEPAMLLGWWCKGGGRRAGLGLVVEMGLEGRKQMAGLQSSGRRMLRMCSGPHHLMQCIEHHQLQLASAATGLSDSSDVSEAAVGHVLL